TSHAKNKIRQFFKKQRRDENIEKGRELVEKEVRSLEYEMKEVSHYIGEVLFSYFGQKPTNNKVEAYLRLEDVHPAADINQLKE
ncbi:hypothetical protein, partial [Bacillus cereus]